MLFSFGEKGGEGAVGIMQGKRAEVWEVSVRWIHQICRFAHPWIRMLGGSD